jgi:hypothetical protein
MNVLAIVASPRKKGLVSTMAQRVLDGAADNGGQVELVNLYDYNLEYCRGCWACRKEGHCVLKDDFSTLFDKVLASDVLILAAPVYWSNVPGIMKTFFDRHCGSHRDWSRAKPVPFFGIDMPPVREEMCGKRAVLLLACTVPSPLDRVLLGDSRDAEQAMKNYARMLEMKIAGKIVFTDTLRPESVAKRQDRFFERAYRIGKRL